MINYSLVYVRLLLYSGPARDPLCYYCIYLSYLAEAISVSPHPAEYTNFQETEKWAFRKYFACWEANELWLKAARPETLHPIRCRRCW